MLAIVKVRMLFRTIVILQKTQIDYSTANAVTGKKKIEDLLTFFLSQEFHTVS